MITKVTAKGVTSSYTYEDCSLRSLSPDDYRLDRETDVVTSGSGVRVRTNGSGTRGEVVGQGSKVGRKGVVLRGVIFCLK